MTGADTDVRPLEVGDAEVLARHLAGDRQASAAWEPARDERYYTPAGQRERIRRMLQGMSEGRSWAGVIVSAGEVIGQVTVGTIVREPFLKGSLGYWVASEVQGRGHATRAVSQALRVMAVDLGLHRAEASTQASNLASQRVLHANGFTQYGLAHEHILLEGTWRDSLLWELTLEHDLAHARPSRS